MSRSTMIQCFLSSFWDLLSTQGNRPIDAREAVICWWKFWRKLSLSIHKCFVMRMGPAVSLGTYLKGWIVILRDAWRLRGSYLFYQLDVCQILWPRWSSSGVCLWKFDLNSHSCGHPMCWFCNLIAFQKFFNINLVFYHFVT